MKIHLQDSDEQINIIHSHGTGQVRVGKQVLTSSFVISPTAIVSNWSVREIQALQTTDVEVLASLNPEVVLLGTGNHIHFPDPHVLRPLIHQRIGYEVMDTGAACRTFNVLVAEGRLVVAGLILTGQSE